MTVSYRMEHVSPEQAQEWLDHNHLNRRLKEAKVTQFARDMTHGSWTFIGDPIRLSEPDEAGVEWLLDGQNRLKALTLSRTTQPFMVFRGLPTEAQSVMDSGTARSARDTLHMNGHRRASQLASSARLIWSVGLGPERFASTKDVATTTEILGLLERNPLIEESLKAVEGVHAKARLRYPVATTSHYFGMVRLPKLTTDFFDKLRTGLDMKDGEPVVALRNRLTSDLRLTSPQQLYLVLRAMNATRAGESMDKIWLPRGSNPTGKQIIGEVRDLTSERVNSVDHSQDGTE